MGRYAVQFSDDEEDDLVVAAEVFLRQQSGEAGTEGRSLDEATSQAKYGTDAVGATSVSFAVCSGLDGVPGTPRAEVATHVERRLVFDTPRSDEEADTLSSSDASQDSGASGGGSPVEQHQGSSGGAPAGTLPGHGQAGSRSVELDLWEDAVNPHEVQGLEDVPLDLLLPEAADLDELIAAAEGMAAAEQTATGDGAEEDAASEVASVSGSAPGPATRAQARHQAVRRSHAENPEKPAAAPIAPLARWLLDGLSFLSPLGPSKVPLSPATMALTRKEASVVPMVAPGTVAPVCVSRVRRRALNAALLGALGSDADGDGSEQLDSPQTPTHSAGLIRDGGVTEAYDVAASAVRGGPGAPSGSYAADRAAQGVNQRSYSNAWTSSHASGSEAQPVPAKSQPSLDKERRSQLCTLFALSENAAVLARLKSKADAGSGAPIEGAVPSVVRLVDHTRAHNISIVLSGIRMTPEALHDAIMQLDSSALEADQLRALLRGAPRSQELADLQAYLQASAPTSRAANRSKECGHLGVHPRYPGVSNPDILGMVEKFFLEVGRVPWLEQRLSAMALMKGFDGAEQQVKELVEVVDRAVHAVRESTTLRMLLGHILAVGNTLNEGTVRAEAAGYKLDALLSLAAIKAADRSTSLLHWMVEDLHGEAPELASMPVQLGLPVKAAANVQLSNLSGLVDELRGGVELMAGQVEALEGVVAQHGHEGPTPGEQAGPEEDAARRSLADRLFLDRCRAFLAVARPRCAALEALQVNCVRGLRELAKFFQDEFDPKDPSRQLQQLRDFLAALEKVLGAIAADKARKAREEAMSKASAAWRRSTAGAASSNATAGTSRNTVAASAQGESGEEATSRRVPQV
ncbi:hypothetical protein GPECTOR_4g547 [Gonium pectorale]|uniref:Formin-like protein n=1 Tax=Gonium pectorale TaxID=33097 RepID=A0A150GXR0_GONPE|nr:hypothetical protein GPECTOR_4g547 [Gonium pectorale]|eukprot:KXZ54482.1 hypothetical protein GPECTOR_4g547 [Gonium pectorale]